MGARASASGIISLGMVAIPYKLYVTASSENIKFRQLCPEHKVPIKQKIVCTQDLEDVTETLKGYEYAKNYFVPFTHEEVEALASTKKNKIEIEECVSLDSFNQLQVEKSYYIGPDKGGDKALKLLTETLEEKGLCAIAKYHARGKTNLVALRPYKSALVLHQLFYSNELREFEEAPANVPIEEKERELARNLIDQITNDQFDMRAYHDEYAQRVHEAVEAKVKKEDFVVAPEAPPAATVIDLIASLKQSLEKTKAKKPSKKKTPSKKKIRKTAR